MISPSKIVGSVLGALVVALILSYLWPLMPKTGSFSNLSWQLRTGAVVICGSLVVGPGRVAYEMITDSTL